MLEGSEVAFGAELEPTLRFAAQVNAIFALTAEVGATADAIERALAPLLSLPGVAKFLRAEVKAVRAAMKAGAGAGDALGDLARRASRLG